MRVSVAVRASHPERTLSRSTNERIAWLFLLSGLQSLPTVCGHRRRRAHRGFPGRKTVLSVWFPQHSIPTDQKSLVHRPWGEERRLVGSLLVASDRGRVAGLASRARELWEYLGGGVAGFTPVLRAAVSPRSDLCPPGWAGIVVIGDTVLAIAPDQEAARLAERALSGVPPAGLLASAEGLRRLPIAEILGPAALAYLDSADFRPQRDVITTPLSLDHPGLRQFLLAAGPGELEESGLEQITTPAFAVQEHGQVVAAAGYRDWPCGIAHLSVLTAPAARGRGLARITASAAVADAIRKDRLPQWRARSAASRRVAHALGFYELGAQVSIRLGRPAD
jgi:hypothetical protein